MATLVLGQKPGPRIQFAETSFDFGEMARGASVRHSFKFTNVGDARLIIENAKTGCGCDYADFPKEPIAPGAEGEITYVYDGNRVGKFTKCARVFCNDSTQLRITLCNTGEIRPANILKFDQECMEHLLIPQGSTAPVAFPYRRFGPDLPSLVPQFHSGEVLSVIWKGVQTAPDMDTVFVWFDTQSIGPFSNSLTLKIESSNYLDYYGMSGQSSLNPEDQPFIYLHFEGEIVGPDAVVQDRQRTSTR